MANTRVRIALAVLATLALSVGFASTAHAAKPDNTGKPDKNPEPAQTLVALGDSYAAGNGAGSYLDSCYRSLDGYPALIAEAEGLDLDLQACSGATIDDLLNWQLSTLDAETDYVTITVGGNDIGFADVISTCAGTNDSECLNAVAGARAIMENDLPAKLASVFGQVQSGAPNATIVVTNYPRLFNGQDDCSFWTDFTAQEMIELNAGASELGDVIAAAAADFGIQVVDVLAPFGGHAICDSSPWIRNFVLFGDSKEFYHPNATGYAQGYAPGVTSALNITAPEPPTKPGKGNNKKTTVTTGGITSSDTERGTVKIKTS